MIKMTETIDWTTVQQKAIQHRMFSPDSTIESIQDLIKNQETIVLESGCTFEQIGEFFKYFTLCIKHSPRVTRDNLDIKSCFPEFLKLNREHWSLGGVSEHDIVFFGIQYTVVIFSWMGFAECPFDKCRGRG